jgi:HD-GYP domain-containing protein (c-di-GMP phosphodiesterase class II)
MKQFKSVRTKTIRAKIELPFDVYIQIGDHYVHYHRRGDDFDSQRLEKLQNKSVKKLYVLVEDIGLYDRYLESCLTGKVPSSSVDDAQAKNEQVHQLVEQRCETILKTPASQESFDLTRNTTDMLINNIQNDAMLFEAMMKGESEGSSFQSMYAQVSTYTTALVSHVGTLLKFNEKAKSELCVAAFLHDIGFTFLDDQELFLKSFNSLNPDQQKQYKMHPVVAKEKLQDKTYVSPDILEYIYNHEERKTGSGYPRGLSKISAEQEVLNMCCYFARLIHIEKNNPASALEKITIDGLGLFELGHIKALKKSLSFLV